MTTSCHKARVSGQLLRYLLTGTLALAIDFGILLLLAGVFHVHYLLAAGISFTASESISYIFSLNWVFEVRSNVKRSTLYFLFQLVGLIGLGLTVGGVYVLSDNLHVAHCREWLAAGTGIAIPFYLLPKAITTVVVFFWHFGAKKWLLSSHPETLWGLLRSRHDYR
jgi:putative flippase GtrA